ncbi:MAG TPA: thioredoxin [Phycisphaerae bacterium]|nr:thioredoxin [Phycisphaerae bacterium]HOI54152.1 thioredoxin [Phycisphaerae bacterium]
MAGQNVVMLTDDSFDAEVLESQTPVLVDFYADWCAPCRMMGPVIDELADEYAGKAKICKLDTDAHRDAPSRYGISAIPTIILFANGDVAKRFVGVNKKADLKAALDAAAQ